METFRGILLRAVRCGDRRVVVDLLTRGGRVSAVAAVGRHVSPAVVQPLSVLDVELGRARGGRLPVVREAVAAPAWRTIPYDGAKCAIAFFLAEFLSYVVCEGAADESVYDYVESSLQWLDDAQDGVANFHLMFIIRLAPLVGLALDGSDYTPGALFDLREGQFARTVPVHPDWLSPADAERMMTLLRMTPQTLQLFRMSRQERNRVIDVALLFYRLHLAGFPPLKTLDVLRQL